MKLRRLVFATAITAAVVCAATVMSCAGQVNVLMDGGMVAFGSGTGYPFVDQNNRTMVPLRVTMETFGADVAWDPSTKTATVEKDGISVKVKVGENSLVRNGQTIPNDTAAVVSGGRTYLPIRAVLESFGAVVGYDAAQQMVTVNSQCSAAYATNLLYSGSAVSNFWGTYNNANAQKAAGNFAAAVPGYEVSVPSFAAAGDAANLAVLYGNLGECLAKSYYYDKAVSCWRKEADYWTMAGKSQEAIAADRKADLIRSDLSLYSKQSSSAHSLAKRFGAPYEPTQGVMLGVYAEMDSAVHDAQSSSKYFMNDFPTLAGKDHAGYLVYLTYGMSLDSIASHVSHAKEKDKIIELALQPLNGLDEVNGTDGYLVQLAKDMEASGGKFFLRFANEMNDPTSKWYTTDYAKYIEKFQTVANIFKQNAPSVAIVWAPNFFPPDTIPYYYPGDAYVDYVGVSCYQNYDETLDPLGMGVDRGRWSTVLDRVYSLYGDRKPIIVAEGGCSYKDRVTGKDITGYAAYQLKDFYTYLPIRYPNVKAVFYYDAPHGNTNYVLSENQTMLEAYRAGIASEFYRSSPGDSSPVSGCYVPVCGASSLPAEPQELCAFAKFEDNQLISGVQYLINGQQVGAAYGAPYAVVCDLTPYAGQNIVITAVAYGSNSNALMSREFHVAVQ